MAYCEDVFVRLQIQPSPQNQGCFAGIRIPAPQRQKLHTDEVNQCFHN